MFLKKSLIQVEVAPYWNVNLSDSTAAAKVSKVEVAPYWNVNIYRIVGNGELSLSRSSTILECKQGLYSIMGNNINSRSSTILECK